MPKGNTILIPVDIGGVTTDVFTEEQLGFTYLNAGYTGYYMNCSIDELNNGTADNYHAADETLTGTVCEIYEDRIVISRYSQEGVHPLGADGTVNPYRPDERLISSEHYSSETSSPQTIQTSAKPTM
jgi:hypothetical protein